ncbi:unnamed protein product [Discula destructiva]
MPDQYSVLLKWMYIATVHYCPAAFFIKATLLLMTARVFRVYERTARAVRWFTLALLIAYTPIQLVKTFVCVPVESFWDPTVKPTRCLNQAKAFFADLSLAIMTDAIILVVPILPIWRLSISARQKLKIVAMLSAGGVALAVTCYRMFLLSHYLGATDITSGFVYLNVTSSVELTIGFVCACLPACNVLSEHLRSSSRDRQERRRLADLRPREPDREEVRSARQWWDDWTTKWTGGTGASSQV